MKLAITILVLCLAYASRAEQIQTRAELDAILGSDAVTDTFETYSQPNGSIASFESILDSSTVVNGQGPGLVHDWITYRPGTGGGFSYFVAAGNYQLTSQAFQTEARSIHLEFAPRVYAMGLDITAPYAGGDAVDVFVFRPDSTFYQISFIVRAGESTFIGWREADGIEAVYVNNSGGAPNSPLIDNVEFGRAAVPEPATLLVVGLGLAFIRRRR